MTVFILDGKNNPANDSGHILFKINENQINIFSLDHLGCFQQNAILADVQGNAHILIDQNTILIHAIKGYGVAHLNPGKFSAIQFFHAINIGNLTKTLNFF
jgi:hypothetical protein